MAPATKSGRTGSAESFCKNCQKTVDELEIEEAFARNTKGGGASRYNPVMLLKVNCLWTDKRQFKIQAISSSGKRKSWN